jgi:hypothetical protein
MYWYEKRWSDEVVAVVLALFWFWSGFVYLGIHYEQINWFGFYEAIVFGVQGLVLLWYGVIKGALYFQKSLFVTATLLGVVIVLPSLQMLMGAGFYNVYAVGMLPLATLVLSAAFFLSLRSKKALHISLIPIIYSAFSLYWNSLLANHSAIILSVLCLAGFVWVVYRILRHD